MSVGRSSTKISLVVLLGGIQRCTHIGKIFCKATLSLNTKVKILSHLPLEECTRHFSYISVQWNYKIIGLLLHYTDSYLLQTALWLFLHLRWHWFAWWLILSSRYHSSPVLWELPYTTHHHPTSTLLREQVIPLKQWRIEWKVILKREVKQNICYAFFFF